MDPASRNLKLHVEITIMKTKQSPKITSASWGEVRVENENKPFKDVKLYPGGCREWNWNETGTHHSPGIQPADIEELLKNDANIIILSKGFNERLQTGNEAKSFLSDRKIKFYILETEKAVEKYNELAKTEAPGALIHSTC